MQYRYLLPNTLLNLDKEIRNPEAIKAIDEEVEKGIQVGEMIDVYINKKHKNGNKCAHRSSEESVLYCIKIKLVKRESDALYFEIVKCL